MRTATPRPTSTRRSRRWSRPGSTRGEVGAADPLQTADDGLRQFPADEIVFAVTTDDEDRDLLARAAERYAVPVSAVRTTST